MTPYKCDQDGIYEVTIYAKRVGAAGQRPFAGGYYFGAFVPGGGILQDGAGKNLIGVTADEGSISYGSNCHNEYDRLHPDVNNGKIDVNDAVRRGNTSIAIRFIRSEADFSPLSKDTVVDFSKGGRGWLYVGVQYIQVINRELLA